MATDPKPIVGEKLNCCNSQSSPHPPSSSSPAESDDEAWERRLPANWKTDLQSILEGPDPTLQYSTKKELFERLCAGVLLDDGKAAYSIDAATGGVCRAVSASSFTIAWGSNPLYWSWLPSSEPEIGGSRFEQAAFLGQVCWLDVSSKIRVSLPPGTYTVSLRISFADNWLGWDEHRVTLSLKDNHGLNIETRGYLRAPLPEDEIDESFFADNVVKVSQADESDERAVADNLVKLPQADEIDERDVADNEVEQPQALESDERDVADKEVKQPQADESDERAVAGNVVKLPQADGSDEKAVAHKRDGKAVADEIDETAVADNEVKQPQADVSTERAVADNVVKLRQADGRWLECDIGQFTVSPGQAVVELEAVLSETKSNQWKGGLYFDGAVIRPSSLIHSE